MAAREILVRHRVVNGPRWRAFLVVCICLAISACYEFLEWWTALAIGADADAFLATQGDPWDTQWDMALAGIGACAALILLGRMHDRQLARFEHSP
ncbi:partial Inner membrane protein YjdF, partial [Rhodocyclaceae bacterium]